VLRLQEIENRGCVRSSPSSHLDDLPRHQIDLLASLLLLLLLPSHHGLHSEPSHRARVVRPEQLDGGEPLAALLLVQPSVQSLPVPLPPQRREGKRRGGRWQCRVVAPNLGGIRVNGERPDHGMGGLGVVPCQPVLQQLPNEHSFLPRTPTGRKKVAQHPLAVWKVYRSIVHQINERSHGDGLVHHKPNMSKS
jgi:hypothetical protein